MIHNQPICDGYFLLPLFLSIHQMASLPGHPRKDLNVRLGHDDVRGLVGKSMLHKNLLDYILHSTCMHYNDANDISYCLGGTVTRQLFPRWLMPISNRNVDKKFEKSCMTFDGFDRGKH